MVLQFAFQEEVSYTMAVWGLLVMVRQIRAFVVANEVVMASAAFANSTKASLPGTPLSDVAGGAFPVVEYTCV